MFTEPVFADFNYRKSGECFSQTKVDLSVKVNRNSVVSYGGCVYPVSQEVNGNELKYSARLVFTVVRKIDEGVVKEEYQSDFSDTIICDELTGDTSVKLRLWVDGVDADATGTDETTLSAVVCSRLDSVVNCIEKQFTGGENMNVKTGVKPLSFGLGKITTTFEVEDEFIVNTPVKDALYYQSESQLTDVIAGVGEVTVGGNVYLSLCLLPFSENSDILKECREIPFRYGVEYSDCTTGCVADACIRVKKTNVKIYVDEDGRRSTVTATVTLEVVAEAFERRDVTVSEDAYSVKYQTGLTYKEVRTETFTSRENFVRKFFGKALDKAPENGRLVCSMDERLSGVTYKIDKTEITVEGMLNLTALFDVDGDKVGIVTGSPFSVCVPYSGGNVKGFCTEIVSCNAKLRSGEIEITADIGINFSLYSFATVRLLTEVTEGQEWEVCTSAVSVYIARKGATLWEVSKDLRISENEITSLNPELAFPLQSDERIIIYRQKRD